MNWEAININIEQSRTAFENYRNQRKVDERSLSNECKKLRADIVESFRESLDEIGITEQDINKSNNSYKVDYVFGLKFYHLMCDKYGMSVRTASNERVWRYMSTVLVPDIVEKRYGIEHPDRFWIKAKRLWLRCIWWYIYLSWQGSDAETIKVLKDNSTDEVLQLVDRCGRGGYRVDVYREIMRKYAEMDLAQRRKNQSFRKLMVLNTARVQVIEPGLVDGGASQYVQDMCDYLQI